MRKLYLFFAMLFTFAISFNMQSQETVIAVWDFADNSVDGAIHADFASAANPNLTYLQGGGSGANAFTNTDETGGDLDMSYTMSTTSANANGWSNYVLNNLQLGPSSATPTAGSGLVGDKIHFSVSFKEITIAQGSGDKVTFILKNSNGGNGAAGGTNEGAGTNQRITGLQIAENGSNNTTLKASTFIINGGNNNGTTKLCGHFGVTQGYTLTDLTIGVTVDYSVGSIRFWIDSPDTYASGDGNAWGFKMYNSDGWANTSGFPALTATPAAGAGLAEAVVQMMQFSPVFQDAGSKMVVDQIKISTGTYENTVAAGNTTTPSTTAIPWSDDFESGTLDNWTNTQAASAPASIWEASTLANSTDSGAYSARHNYSSAGTYDSWLISPTFDLSGATTPVVNYSDMVDWSGDAVTHSLVYSEDYDGTNVDTATWVVLNNTLGTEDTWVENGPYTLPTSATVTVAFRYEGYYAAEWFIDDVSVAEAPTAPSADWTVTPAAGLSDSATVSMTTENFTVAATDGGGDGHWHYTLDGGGTVMMYDTNDVALTGLSSGEHTLVAWLVDNSHQALDPAVEETITWTQTTAPGCGESLSYDYTTGSSGGYNFDVNFTAADAGDLLFTSTVDNAGDHITVTVGGSTESGYDWVYVTDGAGNVLLTPVSGSMDSSVTSTDGTINVYLASDSSVTSGPVTFDVSCAAATYNLTLSVNTQNITVGDGGMYAGGGVLDVLFGNGSMAVPLTDDGTGTWSATVSVPENTAGNYIFVNSPSDSGSYDNKEDLSGLDCADEANWNDRILAAVTEDTVLLHCFGSCETDGTCPDPAVTYATTFNVDMNNYDLPADATVHVNGEFTGWCGDCGNQMTDSDGDGIYTITMDLEDGSYFYKFTVNAWNDQESFSSAVDGCTAANGANFDRQIVVDGADQSVQYCWNSCTEVCTTTPAIELRGIMDIDVSGGVGKAVHLVALEDIADLSVYSISCANNGGGSDGPEYALSGSVTAGQHILVTNDDNFMETYMDASTNFDLVLNAGSSVVAGNGNDPYQLFDVSGGNSVLLESFPSDDAVDPAYSDYSMDWAYQDSWAYKEAGTWTYGGNGCTDDSTTTCESDCPYPFVVCPVEPNLVYADPSYMMTDGDGNEVSQWMGYTTVHNLNEDGTQGDWLWGSAWGVEDIQTTLNSDPDYMTITLEPNYNTYTDALSGSADDIAYWTDGEGGGNKYLHGTTQIESWDAYNAADLTFSGYVYQNTLSSDYTANFFIKCLDPDAGWSDMLAGAYETELPGEGEMFTVTVPAAELPAGKLVQFGFTVYGANANIENQAANGSVILGPDADAPMSVNDPEDVLNLRIYPNPVNDSYINILSPVNGIKYVEVFDINGRKVIEAAIDNNRLDVSSINSGFYLIKVTINGQSKISKLVVR